MNRIGCKERRGGYTHTAGPREDSALQRWPAASQGDIWEETALPTPGPRTPASAAPGKFPSVEDAARAGTWSQQLAQHSSQGTLLPAGASGGEGRGGGGRGVGSIRGHCCWRPLWLQGAVVDPPELTCASGCWGQAPVDSRQEGRGGEQPLGLDDWVPSSCQDHIPRPTKWRTSVSSEVPRGSEGHPGTHRIRSPRRRGHAG